MTAIAQVLDDKLKQWRPATARKVKRQVSQIIALADQEMSVAKPVRRPKHSHSQLSGRELGGLAERMIQTNNPAEKRSLKARIVRGFYGE